MPDTRLEIPEESHDVQAAGRVALVTGGARGIGRGIVERMVAEGAARRCARPQARLAEEAAAASARRGRALAFGGDVAKRNLFDAAQALKDEFGKLDVLVSNANRVRYGPIEEIAGTLQRSAPGSLGGLGHPGSGAIHGAGGSVSTSHQRRPSSTFRASCCTAASSQGARSRAFGRGRPRTARHPRQRGCARSVRPRRESTSTGEGEDPDRQDRRSALERSRTSPPPCASGLFRQQLDHRRMHPGRRRPPRPFL